MNTTQTLSTDSADVQAAIATANDLRAQLDEALRRWIAASTPRSRKQHLALVEDAEAALDFARRNVVTALRRANPAATEAEINATALAL
jgi:hypothetical protein